MSNLTDNPQNPNNMLPLARVAANGGGFNYYPNYNPSYGTYVPERWNNPLLTKIPLLNQPSYYKRLLPDGTLEIYGLSDGATVQPRKWFLTTITDPHGNTTTINYDTSFRVTSVVDAMGRSTTFSYGLSGYPLLITQVTDPFGRAVQFTYDTSQRLSTVTDAVGITTSFAYSTGDPTFLASMTTPYGTTTFNNTLDPNDPVYNDTRSLAVTDPMGFTDYNYYYQNPNIVPTTDASAIVPTGMNTQGNTLLKWRNSFHWGKHAFALGCTVNGSGVVISHDYSKTDILHWTHDIYATSQTGAALESYKRPLENRVWFNYPGATSGVGYIGGTLYTPSAIGRVLDNGSSQVGKATFTSGFTNVNQKTGRTDPLGRSTQYNYATNNIDLLTVQQLTTSPSTYTTIATYGSYTAGHQPQTYTDAAGKTWNYTYTTAGQISTVTDPNSNVTTYNYDMAGRLSTIVDANSVTVLTLTYDSADRILTRTDSQGYTLTYAYDNLDRITSITYPDSTTDLYDYNFQSGPNAGTPSLELRKYTDRLGRVTLRDYDANQRLISITEPVTTGVTRTTSFDYYEDGKLKNLTDANGNVTHWDVDVQSRPTSKTYAYGTASAKTETYAYENSTSRLKSVTDALGQVKTFTYGLDDKITGITYTSSVNSTPNVTFAYDTYFPRLTSMTDGTGTTTYGYTAIGTNGALKLSSIAGPYSNDTIGLTYDALGRLSGRTITGGNETFGYDAISRMTSHGTPLGTFTYGYLGETNQTASRSVTNGSTTVSTSWGYDTNANDRRLISIANSGVTRSFTLGYGSSPVNPYDIMSITDTAATGHPFATQTHGYTYDDSDRLLTGNQTAPGNYTYGYDTLDNATTVTVPGVGTTNPTYNVNNQLATWGANTYSYDANGNTLSGDGARTYKWDAENRLIEIDYVGTSNKTVFTYNGIGQRRAGAETIGGTTTTTRYLWCGSRICQSRDGSDNVLKRFLDEGEYALASGLKLVYMPDQLGSVRDVIDAATGSRVASFDYAPYGAITQSNVTNSVEYQFASLFNHPTSGLLISPSRAYDNVSGRWLSRDAISEPGGINLYVYGSANPIYLIDPSGYAPDACTGNPPTVFYHGTDPKSAFGLIVAAPLSVVVARELSRGGTLGFYLATSIADAEHFALLGRPEGAVVQFTFFGQALTELLSKGAFIQSIAPGKNYRPEGQELFIPPFLFGLFDRLRYTGEIVATPAKIN
jgi:RHS repeat-associated protein